MILTDEALTIRELSGVSELKDSERLQREVWGQGDQPDNADLMLAIQHEGGLVAGAFLDGRMLGFLFAYPTRQPHIQHSHRLAVHPDSRGMGLGLKLKWYQRDWCLRRGITHVRWTYDPMRRINAGLNIARLGATADTYHEDYYGEMEGINAGVPSDRLVADWHLDSPRVVCHTDGARAILALPADAKRVAIPTDFTGLLENFPTQAMAERLRVRAELTAAFASGLRITGYDTKACTYVLE